MGRKDYKRKWQMRAPLIAAACIAACLLLVAFCYAVEPWKLASNGVEVQPRGQLQDYSWQELSIIGNELSACVDEQEAYALGARFGLCSADGSVNDTGAKRVELSDGTSVDAVLAGVWHDERTDGGRAGLSFVFAAAAGDHAMNHAFENAEGLDADSVGGWAASDMRTWLGTELLGLFPHDLRNAMVSVEKHTASTVGSRAESTQAGYLSGAGTDWVSNTSDKLWLLSAAELCGNVPVREDLGVEAGMTQVYASEGSQYRLFADAGIEAFEPNGLLVRKHQEHGGKPCTWWLRTKTLEFGEGFWLVGTDGAVLNGLGEDARVLEEDAPESALALWGPDHARGVVAGFCL